MPVAMPRRGKQVFARTDAARHGDGQLHRSHPGNDALLSPTSRELFRPSLGGPRLVFSLIKFRSRRIDICDVVLCPCAERNDRLGQ